MGAGQSSTSGGGDEPLTLKTSYYTLLDVPHDATSADIKKAYRIKALELHPDRNYGREEDATRLFADIQAAYEVLSDPQERAWYDSHEGAILRGFADGDVTGAAAAGAQGGVKFTGSDDVGRFVAGFALRRVDYENVPDRYFAEAQAFFETLAKEEDIAARMAGEDAPEYPLFGVRDDSYEDVVRPFYAQWGGFSTRKTYFWADKWDLTEADERRVRRAMEKENRKAREDAIREFNNSVQTLVAFVRKRDPRYKPNLQTDTDRQQALRDAAKEQAARSRRQNQKKMADVDAVPDWAKTRSDSEEDESAEEIVEEEFECVACHKTFKSEKQLEAHERSKKHQKAVYALKRKMQKENALLDLDSAVNSGAVTSEDNEDSDAAELVDHTPSDSDDSASLVDAIEDVTLDSKDATGEDQAPPSSDEDDDTTDDDEYAPREAITARLNSTLDSQASSTKDAPPPSPSPTEAAAPKLGKAAQKRLKRAAAAAAAGTGDTSAAAEDASNPFTCAKCSAAFPSRSKMFTHVKEKGHAAPAGTVGDGGNAKRKKGKAKR